VKYKLLFTALASLAVSTAAGGYVGMYVANTALSQVASQVWNARPSDPTRYFVRETGMKIGAATGFTGTLVAGGTGLLGWWLIGSSGQFVTVTQARYQLFKRWVKAVEARDMDAQLSLEAQIREAQDAKLTRP